MEKYILSVLAENKTGVLSKITSLFRRKLFQIDSLTAGKTADEKVSQLTIVFLGSKNDAQKAVGMLQKIVEILSVQILDDSAVVREIVLARFEIKTENKSRLLEEAEKTILVNQISKNGKEVLVELIDTSQRIEDFLEKIKKADIPILEWMRSGVIAI